MADHTTEASFLESDSGPDLNHTSDTDSAYDDSVSRRTQSVTSSVYSFRHEHGRRYHAYQDGQYVVPNDDDEQERLDLQHHLFRLTLDGDLYVAPLPDNVQNVMDVGTGTGIWAMDFADENPSAQVLGVDLSPIQPTEVPPNCSFRIDDVESDWIEAENSYDFIHSRAMVLGFKNWPRFFEQSYRHLKPGGFIELQDLCFPAKVDDPKISTDSVIVNWLNLIIEAGDKIGTDPTAPKKWPQWLREAGFVDIHIKWFNWPIGTWAKQKRNKLLGGWCQADMERAAEASVGLLTRALGWKIEEVQVLQAKVKNEIRAQKVHAYFPVAFCWARKPESDYNYSPNILTPHEQSKGPSPEPYDVEEQQKTTKSSSITASELPKDSPGSKKPDNNDAHNDKDPQSIDGQRSQFEVETPAAHAHQRSKT